MNPGDEKGWPIVPLVGGTECYEDTAIQIDDAMNAHCPPNVIETSDDGLFPAYKTEVMYVVFSKKTTHALLRSK